MLKLAENVGNYLCLLVRRSLVSMQWVIALVPSLKNIHDVVGYVRGTVLSVAIVFLVFTAIFVVLLETFQPRVTIEPIEVPKKLVDMGYTPRVAAQHLLEKIHEVEEIADTTMKIKPLAADWSTPDLVLPAAGLSINSTAAYLRSLLQLPTDVVSGELLYDESDCSLTLRLRLNGNALANVSRKYQNAAIDQVFKDGAHEFVKEIDPFILAAYYFRKGNCYRSKVEYLVSFILSKPPDTESASRAYNLQGLLLHEDKKFDEAIEKYEKSVELNPKFAIAYNNWGEALYRQGAGEGAIEKYKKSIKEDPQFAAAYYHWGYVLFKQSDYEQAVEKFKKAVKLDPRFPMALNDWGEVLYKQGDYKRAEEKFKKAVEVDPQFAKGYCNWGKVLYKQGDHKRAEEKFKKAKTLNSKYKTPDLMR